MRSQETYGKEANHFNRPGWQASAGGEDHLLARTAGGYVQRYKEKQTIFYEGDAAQHVYEIQSGTVKLYKLLPDGRRLITGFFFPGDIIGLASNETYTGTAEAITPVKIISMPRSRVESMIGRDPELAKRLLDATFDELETAQNQMLLLGRMKPMEKVASFLLWAAGKTHNMGDNSHRIIKLPMTRTEIADYLGLTVETVCRVITRLKECKAISAVNTREIVLLNISRLEDYAESTETEYNRKLYAA